MAANLPAEDPVLLTLQHRADDLWDAEEQAHSIAKAAKMKAQYEKAMEEFSRKLASPSAFATNQSPNFSGSPQMAPHFRSRGDAQKRNGVPFVDPQQPVLSVAPLNSIPYTGPPLSSSDVPSSPTQRETDPTWSNEPAVVFLPSRPAEEEWNNIIAATKRGVGLTGSAAMGKVGSTIGLLDIGECEDAYLFRVSLPGVAIDENEFSCDIDPTGNIVIKSVTSTGERIVRKHSQVFVMQTQNLCPPGEFSISFSLPGPVDQQCFTGSFGVDGILEGIVKKKARDRY